LKIVKDGM